MPLITNSNIIAGATNYSYVGPSQYGGIMLPRGQILFSNTKAQSEFLKQYPGIGYLYNQGKVEEIANHLKTYLQQPTVLENQRNKSCQFGQDLNWEKERLKLLDFYRLE